MRWEITVTTHLFVTCRTGFHSAAGEVASRPGRGGTTWVGSGGVGGPIGVGWGAGSGIHTQQHLTRPGPPLPGVVRFAN